MAKNLVIVESPAKAKTIEGYLGADFLVKSSFGHVRDLLSKELSVDTDNNFTPKYEIPSDKKKVVDELKKLSKKAELVWLATDEDREGEAISWHLVEALGVEEEKIRRIVFNEITKGAILKAIENPRGINYTLVNAQQARRVLDRLVGYGLSPVLWKKVKPSLSAGRVQSVAVRLIVERERQIQEFVQQSYYKIAALFNSDSSLSSKFKAELSGNVDEQKAREFLENCKDATYSVNDLKVKPSKRSPSAPFTTSTLQQEASRKMGFSVTRTMVVAQRLYESGKITYMRTDSVNLSDTATNAASAAIKSIYGDEYINTRKYQTKSKGAQEAHEAIRPTSLDKQAVEGEYDEVRLYELIWKRTIASQMSDAQIEKTIVTIDVSTQDSDLVANGEVIKFDGFLKVYIESSDDVEEPKSLEKGVLPQLVVGQNLELDQMTATERFSKHPPRFTEASLVKKLEELGIGRPSTYAPTITTIQKREYVVKQDKEGVDRTYNLFLLENGVFNQKECTEKTGAEKAKLFPEDIGMVVTDFLVQNFDNIMDYHFTANVEKEFDRIADGQEEWRNMLKEFYGSFHENVETTMKTSEKATGERVLGEDPVSGKPVIARIGRYGAMAQIGAVSDEEKPRFASLLKDQSIESITLDEALDLFKLPRTVGDYEGEPVSAAIGRFGPYLRHLNKFYSLGGEDDPFTVELDRAIVLIEEKRKLDLEKTIKTFQENTELQVLKGKYGPYISMGKRNYKIPKDKEPKELTLQECLEIIENAPAKKGRGGFKKRKK